MVLTVARLLMQIAVPIIAPVALRRHRKRGGESPPTTSSSLASPLDGEESSPSGPWCPWQQRGGSPSEIGSPSLFSSVSRSPDLAENRFLYCWRSVTPIALRFEHDFFPDISFLAPEVESQPTYEVGTTHHGTPGASGAPWCLVVYVGLRLQ